MNLHEELDDVGEVLAEKLAILGSDVFRRRG